MSDETKNIKCKKCGAEVIEIMTPGGKHIVNADKVEGFLILHDEYGETIGAEALAIHKAHKPSCKPEEGAENPFNDWSWQDLKSKVGELKLEVKGRLSRTSAIEALELHEKAKNIVDAAAGTDPDQGGDVVEGDGTSGDITKDLENLGKG